MQPLPALLLAQKGIHWGCGEPCAAGLAVSSHEPLLGRRHGGWTLNHRMDATLVLEALNSDLGHRQVEPEPLLLITDQGSQYQVTGYGDLLRRRQIVCSMSAKEFCWDNDLVESFPTLTQEPDLDDNREVLSALQKLLYDLAFWINGCYNRERRHSTTRYLRPIDYEQQFIAVQTPTAVNPGPLPMKPG